MIKKYKLKKDIVIKAGTVFSCVDRESREYVSDNYSTTIGLTKDTSGEIVYCIDSFESEQMSEWFEEDEGLDKNS